MRTLSFVPALVIAAIVSLGTQTAQTQTAGASQGDTEKGRQTVQQVCAACHNNALRMIQSQKRSADQWRDTVYSMIGRGAHVFPEEIDPLVAFLVANSGRSQTSATPTGQAAPASEGRAILERSCQECHDLAMATKKPTGKDWSAVVATMIEHGARVSATDQQKLIEYLNGLPQ
jgi:cytochrome c5